MTDQSPSTPNFLTKLQDLAKWDGSELTPEDVAQMESLPESLLSGFFKAHEGTYATYQKSAELEQKSKSAYTEYLKDFAVDPEEGKKIGISINSSIAKQDKFKIKPTSKKLNKDDEATKGFFITPELKDYFYHLAHQDKERVKAEFIAKNKPKPIAVTTNKRTAFTGEETTTFTEEQSNARTDHKFRFKGDENISIPKGTINKAKTKKTIKWMPVASQRYLGGADSKPDDGKCCGAINWDRSSGSKAIEKTGLGKSAFRVRCDAKADGMCAKCAKGGNPDFFKDTFKITKGSGTKYDGMTYQDFIKNELEYVARE